MSHRGGENITVRGRPIQKTGSDILCRKRHARGHIRDEGWMPSWSWRPLPGKGVGEGNRCPRLENEKVTA
ncbi:MAG: hypothetical protein IJL38_02290 [Bacteroidales bacterium]|nr:hypothetical protein [Bacteroidales bacterium]